MFPNNIVDDLDLFGFAIQMQAIADEPKDQDSRKNYVDVTSKLSDDIYHKFVEFDTRYR